MELAALKRAAEAATPGPYQVITDEHPHYRGGVHKERRIFTLHDHPQLRGPEPIVTSSEGLPEVSGDMARWMVSISAANAAYLAAAYPQAVLELIASHERLVKMLQVAQPYVQCAYARTPADAEKIRADFAELSAVLIAAGAA